MPNSVRIWDLPTRLFHWLLAACFIGLIVSGQIGGAAMTWHFRFGYSLLTLLLFRLLWGFVGGHWSRFATFWPSPAKVWRHLRGNGDPMAAVGHSPLAALSVLAMLLFLLLQVSTGLISDDEIANAGPFTHLVSNALVSKATAYHKQIGKFILIALTLLHLAAVLFYLWRKRENLIAPMLSGDKVIEPPVRATRDDTRTRLMAALLLLVCAGLVALVLQIAGQP